MENKVLPKVNTNKIGNARSIDFYIEIGIYLTLICNFFILLGNSQDITVFVSWPTRIMVSYIFLLALVLCMYSIGSRKVLLIDAWFVILAVYSAACFLLGGKLSQFVSYMCFAMLPSCMALYRRVTHVKRMKKAVYVANTCYAFLFIMLSFADNSHYFQGPYGIEVLEELTLGFNNTNETGIYLMLSFLLMIPSVFYWKKWWHKAVAVVLAVALFRMIWQTECRIAIVLAILATVAVLLQRVYRFGGITRRFVLLLPAIMLAATLLFPKTVDGMSLLGEELDTGRSIIFRAVLSHMGFAEILFGNVPGFTGDNLHNSYLSIMATYGVLTTVLYILFLGKVLQEQHANGKKSKEGYAAYVGVLCVIAHGMAEGALLMAGTVYAGMAGLLFLLMLPEETDA